MAQSLGALIRSARERAKLSRTQLAQRVGVAPNHILRLETPEAEKPKDDGEQGVDPRFKTIALIARELGLSLDDLASAVGYRGAVSTRKDAQDTIQLLVSLRAFRARLGALEANVDAMVATLEYHAGVPVQQESRGRRKRAKRRR